MLKVGNMDNVVLCVHMGVQECAPSGEHLCAGVVHVPAVGRRRCMERVCVRVCIQVLYYRVNSAYVCKSVLC